jgi:CDP-diacylglycerol--serine O-phosphatidyltransferase
MLAFGVAPGCLMYFWGLRESADELGIVACFLYVVCTAIRLARFNITPSSADAKSSFCGLPSPGAAAAIAALIYAFPNVEKTWLVTFGAWSYTVLLGALMVSTFEFISVKSVKITKSKLWYLYILLALAVPICWKFNREAPVFLAALYAFSGPFLYAVKKRAAPQSP